MTTAPVTKKSIFNRPEKSYVNPYLGGMILGIVLFLAFFLTGNGLGSSGATSRIDALIVGLSFAMFEVRIWYPALMIGVITAGLQPLKVLGRGEIGKALTVRAHKFSGKAAEKIAAAGGATEVLGGA